MYLIGIEDRDYKEDKVECKFFQIDSIQNFFYLSKGWSNVYGYNMSCLKNYVMREPLVDTVDKRQICTDHYPLKVKNSFLHLKIIVFLFN
jgi:protein arginine N-methyltransferase 1